MIDIVFLHPEIPSRVYGALAKDRSCVETPIWSLMLAGALRRAGRKVAIVDMAAEGMTVERAVEKITCLEPKLTVAVVYSKQPSASTHNMATAGEVLRRLKSKTAMIGGHPSALATRTIEEEDCDYVFAGEGLNPILKFFGGEFRDGLLDPEKDLSELPWDLLSMDHYSAYNWMGLSLTPSLCRVLFFARLSFFLPLLRRAIPVLFRPSDDGYEIQ